jgi:hypothetical protein
MFDLFVFTSWSDIICYRQLDSDVIVLQKDGRKKDRTTEPQSRTKMNVPLETLYEIGLF